MDSVGVAVDDQKRVIISIRVLKDETAETLEEWLREVAEMVQAEVMVTDDADGFKKVADALGLKHPVCRVEARSRCCNVSSLFGGLRRGKISLVELMAA